MSTEGKSLFHINNERAKLSILDLVLKVLVVALSFGHGKMSWLAF